MALMVTSIWAAAPAPTSTVVVPPPTAAETAQLPAGSGRDLFIDRCAKCHAVGLVIAKPHDDGEWRDLLARMVGFGAQVSPAEVDTIRAYLVANFAPKGGSKDPSMIPVANDQAAKVYPRPTGPNQWPAYGGGGAQQNLSPLTQINTRNVGSLKQAWVYHYGAGQSTAGDEGLDYRFEVTPLIVGGVMYISTPAAPRVPGLKSSITALVPETGEILWKYESPVNIHGRGLAYWPGDANNAPRVIFGTDGGYIMAVDVTTGRPAPGFGLRGRIDAYVGVASEIVGDSRRRTFTIPNPVIVYHNLFITGARPGEVGPPQPRGDIRAWDAVTGRLVWTFHTVPQPGEAGSEQYVGDEWRDLSGANVWSTMALDEQNGIVYAPTGDLNGNAKGSHLYASSLVALDASTGKLKWYRQIVHRDIWDWDSPTPPVLFDLKKNGRTVPAVLLTGKHSLVYLFNRLTGEPLNGFDEKPTPRGDIPTDEIWPTQPFPTAPGPIARTTMSRDEVPNLAPGMRESCARQWDELKLISPPLFSPRLSRDHGVLSYPSATGGPNWGGGSYLPGLGYYIVNIQNIPNLRPAAAGASSAATMNRDERPEGARPRRGATAPPFSFQLPNGSYLSCAATPWGELVAVDVNRLRIAWRAPLGTTENLGPASGARNLGGSIVTASGVVFIGASNDRRVHAYDAKTGKLLWEASLEASAHSTPITYMGKDGKQYVVVAAAGGTSAGGPQMSDTVVAFALP